MTVITASIRRGLVAAFAGTAVGGAALLGAAAAPVAGAAPDACAASQIAKTIGSVSTSIGTYLDTHPETDQALTAIAAQPAGPQSLVATKTYLDANPEAANDLQRLQAPLVRLSNQCKLPVSLPQLLGVMQGAQTPGGVDALVSAGAQGVAEVVSAPGTPKPAVTGTGPLPGPAATR